MKFYEEIWLVTPIGHTESIFSKSSMTLKKLDINYSLLKVRINSEKGGTKTEKLYLLSIWPTVNRDFTIGCNGQVLLFS